MCWTWAAFPPNRLVSDREQENKFRQTKASKMKILHCLTFVLGDGERVHPEAGRRERETQNTNISEREYGSARVRTEEVESRGENGSNLG